MVKFGVSFSRGVKNGGCLFPKMVLFEGPKPSKSMSRPSKSSKLSATSGTQTLLRETNPRGWGGQSSPKITFFLLECQNRLRMSGKKWRLTILIFPSKPPIISILSILGYQCGADFVFHHGLRLLRRSDFNALQDQHYQRFCLPQA